MRLTFFRDTKKLLAGLMTPRSYRGVGCLTPSCARTFAIIRFGRQPVMGQKHIAGATWMFRNNVGADSRGFIPAVSIQPAMGREDLKISAVLIFNPQAKFLSIS